MTDEHLGSPVRFSVPELVIDSESPLASDPLKRQDSILKLTAIARTSEEPLTIAVDAKWGAGKSTFIKIWAKYLFKEEVGSVYVNSWESDFASDPLIPLLHSIVEYIGTQEKGDPQVDQFLKELKEKSQIYAKHIAKAAVRMATFNAVDSEGLQSIASELAGDLTGDMYEQFSESKDAVRSIKDSLESLVKYYGKIVVFVDELDRCRPTYAIELLERIKHLLQIEGVVFVLAVDKEQLSKSITAVYGHDFNSKGYLDRFFDLTFKLPEPNYESYTDYLHKLEFFQSDTEMNLFIFLVDKLEDQPSFRELNRLIYRVSLCRTFLRESGDKDTFLAIIIFSFLMEYHSERYKTFIADRDSIDSAFYFLTHNFDSSDGNNHRTGKYEIQAVIDAVLIRSHCSVGDSFSLGHGAAPRVHEMVTSINHNTSDWWYFQKVHENIREKEFGDSTVPIAARIAGILEFSSELVIER